MTHAAVKALRSDVTWNQEGDGPGYLFDPRTGSIFGLNRTAAALLEGLKRGEDAETLAARLVRRFEVETLTARMDVRAFLDGLEERGLVH